MEDNGNILSVDQQEVKEEVNDVEMQDEKIVARQANLPEFYPPGPGELTLSLLQILTLFILGT